MEYYFVRDFLLVSELICRIKGREEADYIHEYGDEKDIWAWDPGSNKGLEKTAKWEVSWLSHLTTSY